jgi:hypothetical protein
MDEAYSELLRFVPQVKVIAVTLSPHDDYVPVTLLQSVSSRPCLETFEARGRGNRAAAQTCLRLLSRAPILRRFVWEQDWYMIPLSDDEATELSRLLRLHRLEHLTLCGLDLSDTLVARTVCDSICSSIQLKHLWLGNLALASGNDFFGMVGLRLPEMKDLEVLVLWAGYYQLQNKLRLDIELEVDAQCQLAILYGVAHAPKLYDVRLPNCHWTRPVVASLVSCLSESKLLRSLEIRGTRRHNQPNAPASKVFIGELQTRNATVHFD